MIRVPQFHLSSELKQVWEDLKESINHSSPDFYQMVKDVPSDKIDTLPPPIFHTVWKYFNRAKYRSVPYGRFAGVGLLNPKANTINRVIISNEQIFHSYTSWVNLEQVFPDRRPINDQTILIANTSYYLVEKTIRFLIKENHKYELAEIANDEVFMDILTFCVYHRTALEIKRAIPKCYNKVLNEMVSLQLLIPQTMTNLIGDDYFTRKGIDTSNLKQYIISERKVECGNIDFKFLKHLPELLQKFAPHLPEPSDSFLEEFKRRFLLKYEQRLIPIMEALDPEIGIGYGNMEESSIYESLEDDLRSSRIDTNRGSNEMLNKLLFGAIRPEENYEMNLEEILAWHTSSDEKIIPNTLGILCSLHDGTLILDQVYGPTTNRLLGRFSIIGENIKMLCKEVAATEKLANPGVVFFDIAYNGEINVDDVNRREHIYDYQLSILDYDLSSHPLSINDLYLKLVGSELHLVSKSLNRRLIPRLSTAYNHTRSDLPLFRLLCDIQYQGLKINYDFRLANYFPDMDFYPRLVFKNIIAAPAQWKIHYDAFESHFEENELGLKKYLLSLGLKDFAVTRTEDRTLFFDLNNNIDITQLLYIFKKFKDFYLEEGFYCQNPVVIDNQSKEFKSQFLLIPYHECEIYRPSIYSFDKSNLTAVHNFPPACGWLYFNIYVHPNQSNQLLLDSILPIVQNQQHALKKWFFVRFNQNGEHLRIRLMPEDPNIMSSLIYVFNESFRKHLNSGIISDFNISTYKPEVERYGSDMIDQVEHHFSLDSDFVLHLIRNGVTTIEKYSLCTHLIRSVGRAGIFTNEQFKSIVESVSNSFITEHKIGINGFRILNSKFRELRNFKPQTISIHNDQSLLRLKRSLLQLLKKCPAERRDSLFVDVIHMHVNRLFCEDQRTHEMVVYYCSVKMHLRELSTGMIKS